VPVVHLSDAHCELTVHAVPIPPVKHPGVHAPAVQPWPRGHALPHTPQLALSVWRSVHSLAPPSGVQRLWGDWHDVVHPPAEQAWPDGHTLPQTPQLALSVWVIAQ
jgi:hypothetical protein